MNIKDIEKDVLTKADNNLNSYTSSQLVQELQQKWGKRNVFDVVNKLQEQGYLVNCIFYMDRNFSLGYLTPKGNIYLKGLNNLNKKEHSIAYQNNFNSKVYINNLQQGDNNSIAENQVDYSALLKTIDEINELKTKYMSIKGHSSDFYKTLDKLQESAKKKEPYEKLKSLWDKLQSILDSNSVGNISSIISTIIAACTAFK